MICALEKNHTTYRKDNSWVWPISTKSCSNFVSTYFSSVGKIRKDEISPKSDVTVGFDWLANRKRFTSVSHL